MSKRETALILTKAIVLGVLRYLQDKSKDKKQPKNKNNLKTMIDEGTGLG